MCSCRQFVFAPGPLDGFCKTSGLAGQCSQSSPRTMAQLPTISPKISDISVYPRAAPQSAVSTSHTVGGQDGRKQCSYHGLQHKQPCPPNQQHNTSKTPHNQPAVDYAYVACDDSEHNLPWKLVHLDWQGVVRRLPLVNTVQPSSSPLPLPSVRSLHTHDVGKQKKNKGRV